MSRTPRRRVLRGAMRLEHADGQGGHFVRGGGEHGDERDTDVGQRQCVREFGTQACAEDGGGREDAGEQHGGLPCGPLAGERRVVLLEGGELECGADRGGKDHDQGGVGDGVSQGELDQGLLQRDGEPAPAYAQQSRGEAQSVTPLPTSAASPGC